MTGGRRAPGSVRRSLSAAAVPLVLSAVCEWHLPSQLFSPHSTARPTTEFAWALRTFVVANLLLLLLLAHYLWTRERVEVRPVLAWGGL